MMPSGKSKLKESTRDVLFNSEGAPPTEKRRGKSTVCLNRKGQAKGMRYNSILDSSRVASGRLLRAEVRDTQEQKHALSIPPTGIRWVNVAAPALGRELPSDPIEGFSSPSGKSTVRNTLGIPTRPSSSSQNSKALTLAVPDSSDEMSSTASITLASSRCINSNDIGGSAIGGIRSANKGIPWDDDDFLLLSMHLFTNHLPPKETRSPRQTSTSTFGLGLSRASQTKWVNQFRLNSRSDRNNSPGFKVSYSSFLERWPSQVSSESSLPRLNPLASGGFYELWFDEDQGAKGSVDTTLNALVLTVDIGLKPALEVRNTLKRKAEAIFEKEGECIVAAAAKQDDRRKEILYINDHGFVTQTRPEGSSPPIYRTIPLKAGKVMETQGQYLQTQMLGIHASLCTPPFVTFQETPDERQPVRRLHKCNLSPLGYKINGKKHNAVNGLNALRKAHKSLSKEEDKRHEGWQFVAIGTEEYGKDDMNGFEGPNGDDEYEDLRGPGGRRVHGY